MSNISTIAKTGSKQRPSCQGWDVCNLGWNGKSGGVMLGKILADQQNLADGEQHEDIILFPSVLPVLLAPSLLLKVPSKHQGHRILCSLARQFKAWFLLRDCKFYSININWLMRIIFLANIPKHDDFKSNCLAVKLSRLIDGRETNTLG